MNIIPSDCLAPSEMASAAAPLGLDLVPDQRGNIGAAEIFHGADAGRRGDVDLGEKAVDHVDANEQQTPLAQSRSELGADFTLARGEVGRFRHAAAHHVGTEIVGGGYTVDRASERAIDQNDALVALFHSGKKFLHHPRLAKCRREQVVERAEIEILASEAEHGLTDLAIKRLHHAVAVLSAK